MIRPLYEDNHLLVVVKEPGIPVQADASGDPDLLSLLKAYLKEKYDKPGNVYLGLVHRLDRMTGGVMVFAKTSKAAARLAAQFRNRSTGKHYLAVTTTPLVPPAGRLVHRLTKDREHNMVRVDPAGQEAVLEYVTRETAAGLTLVGIALETGRGHQIRVQLAAAGAPLWGDHRYGDGSFRSGENLALWAATLELEHPVGGEPLSFNADPPDVRPWNRFHTFRR